MFVSLERKFPQLYSNFPLFYLYCEIIKSFIIAYGKSFFSVCSFVCFLKSRYQTLFFQQIHYFGRIEYILTDRRTDHRRKFSKEARQFIFAYQKFCYF